MPITGYHALTMTTPDDPAYENRPSHWNSAHAFTANMVGSEISNAFGNGGGVSFGLSADGKITASAPAGGGGLTNINVSAGTTSNLLSAITFGDANGVSFGLNASTLTASHNGLTSQSNQAFSAAGGSSAFQTLPFGNSFGISFSNSNGSVVGSIATTYAGTGVSTAGSNVGISGTLNTAGLSLSVTAPNAVYAVSGSNGSFTANTVTFGNLNGMSFYTSNGSIVGSYTDAGGAGGGFSAGMSNLGNTSGTSGTVGSQIVFVGTNGINLSQSVNGNSATLSIYTTPQYISSAENITFPVTSNFQRPTQSTFILAPIQINNNLSFDWIANLRSIAVGSTSFATTNATSFSFRQEETHRIVLYSKNTGANSLSLGSISSTTCGMSYSVNLTAAAAGSNFTVQHGFTYPVRGGTSTYSTSYGVSNASFQFSSTHMTNFAGAMMGVTDFAGSLTPGNYWIGYNQSTTITTNVTNASGLAINMSYACAPLFNASVRSGLGIASNAASHGLYLFNGSASVGGGTAISSISMGQVSQLASNVMAHIRLGRFV